VLRAAGETETAQENIQDWLQLDDGDPGFQLLTEEQIAVVIFYKLTFISNTYIINFFIYFFLSFLSFIAIFCSNNLDYQLIRRTPPN
jgi:hypothetical protein